MKLKQKVKFILLTVALMILASSFTTAFAAEKTMSIEITIEGIEQNLLKTTIDIPYEDTLTMQNALAYLDEQEAEITMTGVDSAYITNINGEAAGSFGGWDGWLYKVNGQDPIVGIDSLELSDGDSLVLYYGDPFGVGMQFPAADTSDIQNGIITFTSADTTFDESYNAVVTVNPVVGATVSWWNGDTITEYVTDDNGTITVAADQLTEGAHAVQITKTGDTKLPLVLRFAPDYTISVEGVTTDTVIDNNTDNAGDATVDTAIITNTEVVTKADSTGERYAATIAFGVFAILALVGIILFRRKEKNEK